MTILAIDTSSDLGSAAVRVEGRIAAERRLEGSMQYSERLFASIDEVIRSAGAELEQIDVFAAARGPGSFTGLRVGLAAVEGLAFAKRKEARGISSLSALAWQVRPAEGLIAPMLDARRGDVYAALYRWRAEELVEVRAPAVLQPAQWIESLPAGPIVFCGGGADRHRPLLDRASGSCVLEVDPYLAATIAGMADAGYREPLEPLYIRPSDAKLSRAR